MISTQTDSPDLAAILKSACEFENMACLSVRPPFDPAVVRLLAALSEALRKQPQATAYPDIMALAFFLRPAQLARFAESYADLRDAAVGRGLTFHIAPSNVAIMFAYSLVVGLLSGNACIVRVSEQDFPQVRIVCATLQDLLAQPDHRTLADYIAVVRYGHDLRLTRRFSSLCDVRIIWGGDRTIADIRQAPLPAKSYDIVFSDRYSALVVGADAYLAVTDKARLADGFYNDTYLFDQNACSSPRLVYWVGDEATIDAAQALFWQHVAEAVERKDYRVEPVTAVGKYVTLCRAAVNTGVAKRTPTPDNRVVRIALGELGLQLPEYDCVSGVFFEFAHADLSQLAKIVSRKLQTLLYIGFDAADLRRSLIGQGACGVDRIVPVGEAGSFSLVWDGYDVIRQMCRVITAS